MAKLEINVRVKKHFIITVFKKDIFGFYDVHIGHMKFYFWRLLKINGWLKKC